MGRTPTSFRRDKERDENFTYASAEAGTSFLILLLIFPIILAYNASHSFHRRFVDKVIEK